jgi:L-histidine Nalpha-methyltransferase
MIAPPITLAIHTVGLERRQTMGDDVRRGLLATPRELPCRYFYDDRGSRLFDEITRLPEYYLTRAETEILQRHAGDIVALAGAESLVELGAGTCAKSRFLIDAGRRHGSLRHFVPFDISEVTVQQSAHELVEAYPGLTVYGLVGDFGAHLGSIPRLGRQLVLFLGSTIGNFDPSERVAFLREVRALMEPDDLFLLGVDLDKDPRTLLAAYDDAAGVTAEFNLNLLRVLNRELGADFDLDGFAHEARYDGGEQRIEMHLRSLRRQTVTVPGAGAVVEFEPDERMSTEISSKFTRSTTEANLGAAGMRLHAWFTDEAERFALALAAPM